MKNTKLPFAVVLDIGFGGYGIIKSLAKYKIPVIGFKPKVFYFESATRLCEKIITYYDMVNLLENLIEFGKKQERKSVLYLTNDNYVYFVHKNLNQLKDYYMIDLPDKGTIDILMDKLNFTNYAIINELPIPKTIDLRGLKFSEIKSKLETLEFPIILKPWLRTSKWNENLKEKAFLCDNFQKFEEIFNLVREVEESLLVQEYIPGGDDHVYYCLSYFDSNYNSLSLFTGQKIRQWPILTGSTATTVPCDVQILKTETEKIFKLLNYKGFGSIEYKKHAVTGNYYITEPTVGRVNQQEYVATLNGTNFPLIAYNYLTGENIQQIKRPVYSIIYIDEIYEIRSIVKYFMRREITLKKWLKSINGKRAYRYSSWADPIVGIRLILLPFVVILKRVKRYKRKNWIYLIV